MQRILFPIIAVSLLIIGCSREHKAESAKAQLMAVADAYLEETLNNQPEIAYFVGLDLPDHAGLSDNSAKGISDFQKFEEVQYKALLAIDEEALKGTPEWVLWGQLKEMLTPGRFLFAYGTFYPQAGELQGISSTWPW